MAQLLVRNLDPAVKEALQRRARRHGRSMEEEVRRPCSPMRGRRCSSRDPARHRRGALAGPPAGTALAHVALLATGHGDRFGGTAIGVIDPLAF